MRTGGGEDEDQEDPGVYEFFAPSWASGRIWRPPEAFREFGGLRGFPETSRGLQGFLETFGEEGEEDKGQATRTTMPMSVVAMEAHLVSLPLAGALSL